MQDSKEIQRKFYDKYFSEESNWSDVCFDAGTKYFLENFISSVIQPDSKKVLEIGCGNGLLTFFLLKRQLQITAVDISEKAVDALSFGPLVCAFPVFVVSGSSYLPPSTSFPLTLTNLKKRDVPSAPPEKS